MSPRRLDRDSLGDIEEAARRIAGFIHNVSYEEFFDDLKTQDAVIRNLEIIGEAVKNLSTNLRAEYQCSVEEHGRAEGPTDPRLLRCQPGHRLACCSQGAARSQTTGESHPSEAGVKPEPLGHRSVPLGV